MQRLTLSDNYTSTIQLCDLLVLILRISHERSIFLVTYNKLKIILFLYIIAL